MNHLGKDCAFTALGQRWTAGRQTRRVLIEFADWARPQIANPVNSALEDVERATMIDARIVRQLIQDDTAEQAKALAENRQPALLLPKYKPIANGMVEQAQQRKDCYKDISSPEILAVLNSLKGQARLFLLLLRKHHPDVTEAIVDDILDDLSGEEITRITRVTSGTYRGPEKNDPAPAE